MKKVKFYFSSGLGNNSEQLLIGVTDDGYKSDELYDPSQIFPEVRLRHLKSIILKKFEIFTGEVHRECDEGESL